MRKFTDAGGNDWEIVLDVTQIKRLLDGCKVDLRLPDPAAMRSLLIDPILLADALFTLCSGQAQSRQLDSEAFGRLLRGDSLEAASVALLEEWADFFPRSRRTVLTAALAKGREVETLLTDRAMETIRLADPNELMRRLSGDSSGSSRAPSESIPAA